VSTLVDRLNHLAQANPLISKELRSRMRSGRTIILLTVYLSVLSLVALGFYWIIYASASLRSPYDQQVGRDLLYAIVTFGTLLVTFLAPAVTAGAISGERERQTFDLLMTTLLRPRAIVLGKMGAALAFLLLLILAVAPLESLAFMIGGVAPEEILGSLVVLVCGVLLYGSLGIFWSSLMRSTAASTVLAYATMLLVLAGFPFIWFITSIMLSINGNGSAMSHSVIYVYFTGLILSTNPLIAMGLSETFVRAGHPLFFYTDDRLINGQTIFILQPWVLYCLLAVIVSALLLAWSVRLLPPVRRHQALAAARQAIPAVSGTPVAGPPLANAEHVMQDAESDPVAAPVPGEGEYGA